MGKSKKQKQKKKDFLKRKLKVGKKADHPSNQTDTSFVAKTISLKNQHLEHETDLSKRLTLLRHHNITVRKETLQDYQKHLPEIIKTQLMTPLLTHAIPLICDDSLAVRDSLIDLLDEVGKLDVHVLVLHCNIVVLYINMAMTHIMPRIQMDSTRFLGCLLKYCSDEVVRQAWLKLLNGVIAVLGWGMFGNNQASGALQTKKRDSKYTKVHLDVLTELIRVGCSDAKSRAAADDTNNNEEEDNLENYVEDNNNISEPFMLAEYPQPYEYLKLFARTLKNKKNIQTDELAVNSSMANQDIDSRRAIFKEQFLKKVDKQVDAIIKDGGECGKSANNLKQLLDELFV
ncbi:similar to Saccharomyces cerevisiae YHR085W IPI1 Essential component of the Rix1 complex (with Rix1p and Ipi3p) that is required for processing of ITS2 sequences from 35S pre-rRNA [Maudiozyma barnettii]|uniref:Pre-rRNA-processing protein n=1 Tax=Maudiozyma barnettii TaxID=61262 RepID=A0A8H2ZGR2_9SACH|nr:Ipi1p [Kazachstania barnettii]CAB4253787.1 similar to Saccharomyces cerevisiae YHR085W IPI1 Essential component of the Rix1 complex (with Rix1p and Ipi3p) that is required for processing of ITS2 sequences from 35S pre-rRNA [Kazachstania barnettii]CAD1781536.1 similar to Saccharomyces cerevisiae YHR085W IPI1 Essential component of the Rix1 complex (with Rix1p and Ipi3p) that is required for processing of ITS2 sequences from 35S pre-rRNA [Kazachstania barnettii]